MYSNTNGVGKPTYPDYTMNGKYNMSNKEEKYKKIEALLAELPSKRKKRSYCRKKPLSEIPRYNRSYVKKSKEDAAMLPSWHFTKSKCQRKMIIARYNKNKPKSEHTQEPCQYRHITRDGINFAQCGLCKQLFCISFVGDIEKTTYAAIKWNDDD